MSPGDAGVIPNWGWGGRVGSGGEATAHFRGGDCGAEGSGRNGRREKKTPTGREKGQLIKRRTIKYNWKMLSWGLRSLVQRQEQFADKDNTCHLRTFVGITACT